METLEHSVPNYACRYVWTSLLLVIVLLSAGCSESSDAIGAVESLEGPEVTIATSASTDSSTSIVSSTTTTTTEETVSSATGSTTTPTREEEMRVVVDDLVPTDVPVGVSQQLALFGGGGYVNCGFDMWNGEFLESAEAERRGLWLLGQYFRTDGGEGPAGPDVGVRGAVLVFCVADSSLVPGEIASVLISGTDLDVELDLEVVDVSSSEYAAAVEFDSIGLLPSGDYEIAVDTGAQVIKGSFSLIESPVPHLREAVLLNYTGDDLLTDDLELHILGHQPNTSVDLLLYEPVSDMWKPIDEMQEVEIPVYRFVKILGSVAVDSKGSANLVLDIPDDIERRYCVITDQMESAYADLFERIAQYVQTEDSLSSGWDAAGLFGSADPCQLAPGFGPIS